MVLEGIVDRPSPRHATAGFEWIGARDRSVAVRWWQRLEVVGLPALVAARVPPRHMASLGRGDRLQRVRGVVTGALVGIPLALYVNLWLHGVLQAAALVGFGVGLAVALVVGTRSDPHDAAADAAWREAAADLPPVSDRIALERLQEKMPGPGRNRRSSAAPVVQSAAPSGSGAGEGAEAR